jgi:hypothetical protein
MTVFGFHSVPFWIHRLPDRNELFATTAFLHIEHMRIARQTTLILGVFGELLKASRPSATVLLLQFLEIYRCKLD